LNDKINTIRYYEKQAESISVRYESANVGKLQKELLLTMASCNSILELGCGSGRDAAFLLQALAPDTLIITDGSDNMLALAAKCHPELAPFLIKLKLPEDLKSQNRTYDGIYSIATLMHLTTSGIIEFLHEATRLLKASGVLFVSVCTTREEQAEDDLRTFTLKNKEWWIGQFGNAGLRVTEAAEATDGLNRNETIWLNITAKKQS